MMCTVGVVGHGYVGQAVAIGFSPVTDVKVWDKDTKRSPHTLEEIAGQDIIFICVPTPTNTEGIHKIYNVNNAIAAILKIRQGDPPVIVIKSTVLPGTCDLFSQSYDVPIVSNPEFLTARTAVDDFRCPISIVLGSDDIIALNAVYGLYKTRFPDVPIILYENARTAELVKYARNCFYAVKMAMLNEMAVLCQHLGIHYDDVKEGLLASGWVNPMHCDVPGHDGKPGFGGACLPKDGRALVGFGCDEGVPLRVLDAALESNEKVRHGD